MNMTTDKGFDLLYSTALRFKSRKDTAHLEKLVAQFHDEAMQKMTDHFGYDMMRQLATQGNLKPITVTFCGRLKRSLGNARTQRNNKAMGEIKLHKKFFLDNGNKLDQLKETYVHELAHVLINRIYNAQQHHNTKWKKFLLILGGDGEQYHTMDVAKYSRPKKAECDCADPIHYITTRKYNQIRRGEANYKCKTCRIRIRII